jgi:hypothetical protein
VRHNGQIGRASAKPAFDGRAGVDLGKGQTLATGQLVAGGIEKKSESAVAVDLARLVCYVCMTPASFASKETIQNRRNAVDERRTTTHWPHELAGGSRLRGAPAFPQNPYIVQSLVTGDAPAPTHGRQQQLGAFFGHKHKHAHDF